MSNWRIILTGTLLATYVVYVGLFYIAQRQLVFPGQHLPALIPMALSQDGIESIWLETRQGKVEAWYLSPLSDKPDDRQGSIADKKIPAMIVAHGNGEMIDFWIESPRELRRQGFGVLLVEYPGYGRSEGKPSQEGITETMILAYDWLIAQPEIDRERVIFFGQSIGGGAVCALAAQRPSAALVLFSTFQSVKSMAATRFLPSFLVRDPFDNLSVVENYTNPILILHGDHDEKIPYTHGEALHAAAPDSELITYECGHNDCVNDWTKFWQDMLPFLERAGVIEG